MSRERNATIFMHAIPLHLSGYLQKPFKADSIKELILNIIQDLAYFNSDEKIQLKNGYSYDVKHMTLFDENYNIIKLTKNEIKLMQILSLKKDHYVSSETIEYTIWEEESLEEDCNKRLKHLIYCLRKKLPKDNLVNAYNLGYKFSNA